MHSIYCKVKEMIHGETSHAILIKRCKCMCGWIDGWMDGWMDGCGLLLEVMVFSLESSLVSSFFLRHGYPFFSLSLFFFGSCFFGMPSSLQETIYSVTEHFCHRSLKIRHKNLSVTFSDSVMY